MQRLFELVAVIAMCLVAGCGGADAKAGSAASPAGPAKEGYARTVVASPKGEMASKKAPAEEPPAVNMPPPAPPPPPGQPPQTTTPAPGASAAVAFAAEEPARDPSMIVYTARITMAVYQVDTGIAAVEKIAHDMGGFLAKKGDREIVIRVPRARFQPALAAVDKIGDVLHRDVQAQDVTDEYTDLEIRIKNGKAMQARLKQLLERAAVKEALEIEKELARVTQELELLEGKLKLLRDKIAYSTITVAFEPRGSTLQTSRVRLPFPWLGQLGLPGLLQLEESR